MDLSSDIQMAVKISIPQVEFSELHVEMVSREATHATEMPCSFRKQEVA